MLSNETAIRRLNHAVATAVFPTFSANNDESNRSAFKDNGKKPSDSGSQTTSKGTPSEASPTVADKGINQPGNGEDAVEHPNDSDKSDIGSRSEITDTKDTQKQPFRIHEYDPISGAVKRKRIIELNISVPSDGVTLGKIRKDLVKNKGFDKFSANSPFCDVDGTVVSDEMTLSVYEDQVRISIEENQGEKEDEDKKKKNPTLDAKVQAKTKAKDIYYKKNRLLAGLSQPTKDFQGKGVDLTLKDPAAFLKADPTLLKSSYDASLYRASEGGKLAHPADLTEHEWSIIVRTNCILSGHILVEYDKPGNGNEMTKAMKVQRSPYNAFTLKPRAFKEYDISAPSRVEVQSYGSHGKDPKNKIDENAYCIPRFWVDDDSYVTVVETKNSLQHSMAKNSFSEESIQGSVSGGFGLYGGSFSYGQAKDKGMKTAEASASEKHQLTITYKFPRVSVLLDSDCLEISKECKDDLEILKKNPSDIHAFIKFGNKYGHVFAQRVELGGQLSSSEQVDSTSKDKIEEKTNSMRRSAALSFSSPYVQGSGSYSKQGTEESSEKNANQNFNNSMVWEAKGGNTLLCNNPPSWCATVGDFYNWRVIQQHDVVPICEALCQFEDYKDLASMFKFAFEADFHTIRFRLIEQGSGNPLRFTNYLASHPSPNTYSYVPIMKISSDRGGLDILEARVPKHHIDDGKIYLNEPLASIQLSRYSYRVCFSNSGSGNYLSFAGEEVQLLFQTSGEPKMKGPITSDTTFEIVVIDPKKNENLGLLMKRKEESECLGIEHYKWGDNGDRILEFKLEIVSDK
ncbi:hypothetical protein BBP40_008764 [Aspergillus hancockii]|nr:hypothetical protein BBP40_008764 [Aspergillus hancockii]